MPKIAVLTGDLIASTQAGPEAVTAAMTRLAVIAEKLGPETRFTRFRGDGWQMLLQDPGWCLWVPLWLLATLRADPLGLSSRIGIGLGEGRAPSQSTLSAADGSAFVASGRALDSMKSGQILALAGDETDDFQRCLVAFAEDRAKGWSTEQARALYWAFSNDADGEGGPTHFAVAAKLGITRQAVGARLHAGGYTLLRQAMDAFRNHYGQRRAGA